jgi:hypothetical protein
LVSLKRALRKRDVPRSVQDFLKCSGDGSREALAEQRSWR